MYQNKYNELKLISIYASGYGKRFYLREISKITKIPLKTTQNILQYFESQNILKSLSSGKNKYFALNMENISAKFFLVQAEIYKTQVLLKKYPQLKLFAKEIKANQPLIIFGSFAGLSAGQDSDIDLVAIGIVFLSILPIIFKFLQHKLAKK